MTPCSSCNGTGNRNYDIDLDDMVVDSISDEDCPDCGGTGWAGSSGTETTPDSETAWRPGLPGRNTLKVSEMKPRPPSMKLLPGVDPAGSSGTETP
jgi:hypothetical protein